MELLPYLSAYMGHSEFTSTLYYVHLLPEKLRRSKGIDWDFLSRVYGKGCRMMRIKAKDPRLVSLMGEFIRVYLPCVRNRDEDTVPSYRYSINLFVAYLETENGVTVMTMRSSDFNQKNIVGFMSWLKSTRNNVATTVNHRLSDIHGFCRYLYKKMQSLLTSTRQFVR